MTDPRAVRYRRLALAEKDPEELACSACLLMKRSEAFYAYTSRSR